MQLEASDLFNILAYMMMTCRISLKDGIKLCEQQVKYLRRMSFKVSQNENMYENMSVQV